MINIDSVAYPYYSIAANRFVSYAAVLQYVNDLERGINFGRRELPFNVCCLIEDHFRRELHRRCMVNEAVEHGEKLTLTPTVAPAELRLTRC